MLSMPPTPTNECTHAELMRYLYLYIYDESSPPKKNPSDLGYLHPLLNTYGDGP